MFIFAKFHCRLTTVQNIQDYVNVIFGHIVLWPIQHVCSVRMTQRRLYTVKDDKVGHSEGHPLSTGMESGSGYAHSPEIFSHLKWRVCFGASW